MQSMPVSPAVQSVPVAKEASGPNVAATDSEDVQAADSFGEVLDNQLKSTEAGQIADAAKQAKSLPLPVLEDQAGQADTPAPATDLASLLASLMTAISKTPSDGALPRAEARLAASQQIEPGNVAGKGNRAELAFFAKSDQEKQKLPTDVEEISKHSFKHQLMAEIAEDGKKLPVAAAKGMPEFSLREHAPLAMNSQPVAISRPDLPAVASVQANNHAVVNLAIAPRVGTPAWDGALGQKVMWLVNQNQQTAEMQLNPPNLGPLEVKLTISNDQATALFVSPHAAVRDAVESALPRLREMLAENGITLGNVNVGSESFAQEQASGSKDQPQNNGHHLALGQEKEGGAQRSGVMHLPLLGLVDTFA